MAEKEYIEREKAAQILRKEAANHYPTPYHVGLLAAARAIDNIPAADVLPVVRGRWEESADQLQASCSVCKTSFPCWRMWPANYCPNCGADMRGEQDV